MSGGTVARAIEEASVGATSANQHLRVTAAYGIAVYPNDAPDAEALIAHADRALYEAKAQLMDVRSRSEERHAQDVFFAIGDAISSSLDPRDAGEEPGAVGCDDAGTGHLLGVARRSDDSLNARAFFVSDAELPRKVNEAQRVQPMTRAEALNRGLITDRTTYVDDVVKSKVLGKRFRELLEADTWMITVPLQGAREGFLMMTARHQRSVPLPTSLAEAIARLASAALQNAETYARAHRQAEQLRDLAGLGGLLLGEAPTKSAWDPW